MDEDGAKVDLKISVRHAHQRSTLLTVHCQVKSGSSYRAASTNSQRITLASIDAPTLTALQRGTQPALLCWVPPLPSSRIYYHIVSQASGRTPIRIPRTDFLTPVLRYDLSMAAAFTNSQSSHLQLDVAAIADEDLMFGARKAYSALHAIPCEHPLLGRISITRKAWRHVTRRSRSGARRNMSLRAAGYLKHFLARLPSRYFIANSAVTATGAQTTHTRDIICSYEKALRIQGQRHSLLFRFNERITYPTKWWQYPLGINDIGHHSTLVGWWCK